MVSLLPVSAGIDLLKKSLARLSNLALTSGDFSECSDRSELSCSELADRLLQIEGRENNVPEILENRRQNFGNINKENMQ